MDSDTGPNESAPTVGQPFSLGRNGACLPCRKRKMRCDGVRPICANCEKVLGKKRWRGLVCAWEDKPDTGQRIRRRKQGGDYAHQEEPERSNQHTSSNRARSIRASATVQHAAYSTPVHSDDSRTLVQSLRPSPTRLSLRTPLVSATTAGSDFLPKLNTKSSTGWSPIPTDLLAPSEAGGGVHMPRNASGEVVLEADSARWTRGVIPSGWPADLPGPDVLFRVCKLFFERVPTIPKMLHRRTFFQSLGLPPTHKDFPAPCLLHAILSVTAPHLPPSTASDPAYLPRETVSATSDQDHPMAFEELVTALRSLGGSFHLGPQEIPDHPLGAFQLWHRRKAFAKVSETFDRGGDMVQAVQAQCIATTVDRYNAWWTDVWQEAGATVRLAIPLGLNESQRVPEDGLKRVDNLKPPVAGDRVRQAIEDRTWWMCYLTEREFGMSTAWTEAIPDDEISVELPVTQAFFDAGVGDLRGAQTLQSEDLYYAHPPVHADSLSLLIKSVKLFSEINKFYRKYSRFSHTIAGFLSHPTFQGLMRRVSAMRRTFPNQMQWPTQGAEDSTQNGFDVDLIAAAMTFQAATLTLLEPCITSEMYKSTGGQLAASSISAVEHMLHEINATGFDITLLPSVCPFVWCLCGKGLVKFIAAANEQGDGVSIGIYQPQLEVFRLAMTQHGQRFPVARRYLKVLDETARRTFGEKNMAFQCTSEQILDPSYLPSRFGNRLVDVPNESGPSTFPVFSSHQTQSQPGNDIGEGDFTDHPMISRNSSKDQIYADPLYSQAFAIPLDQGSGPTEGQITAFPGSWSTTESVTPILEQPSWLTQTPTNAALATTELYKPDYTGPGQYFVYGSSVYPMPNTANVATGTSSTLVPQYPAPQQISGQPIETPLIDLASTQALSAASYVGQRMPVLRTGDTTTASEDGAGSNPAHPQLSEMDWDSVWKEFSNMVPKT